MQIHARAIYAYECAEILPALCLKKKIQASEETEANKKEHLFTY